MIGLKQLENESFAILVCAGLPPSKTLLEHTLSSVKKTKLYCADGGARYLKGTTIIPDVIIGDMDSLEQSLIESYLNQGTEVITYPPEKDFSDTELALNHLIEEGEKKILLLGATGGRLDHYFANLMLMANYGRQGVTLSFIDDSNFISYLAKGCYEVIQESGYLSFFALSDEGMRLSLSGVKYPLYEHLVPFGASLCLSNEFISDAKVRLNSGDGVMILSEERVR